MPSIHKTRQRDTKALAQVSRRYHRSPCPPSLLARSSLRPLLRYLLPTLSSQNQSRRMRKSPSRPPASLAPKLRPCNPLTQISDKRPSGGCRKTVRRPFPWLSGGLPCNGVSRQLLFCRGRGLVAGIFPSSLTRPAWGTGTQIRTLQEVGA